jgi:hypothetical protein
MVSSVKKRFGHNIRFVLLSGARAIDAWVSGCASGTKHKIRATTDKKGATISCW